MFIEPHLHLTVLSEYILRLSDFFIHHPEGQTPWSENFCKHAYRYYYLPLNYLRNELVIQRGNEVSFFQNIETTVDWGAGPGTASFALAKYLKLKNQILIEKSTEATKSFQDLQSHLFNFQISHDLNLKNIKSDLKKSMLVFSYSLTEMACLPDGWSEFESIMILEPSTKQDGRKLLSLRQKLIENGYFIWAPCTHQQNCPLLAESKTDWCHDRIHVQAPKWFIQLEQNLPFKNKTITTSYLLARKTKPTFNFEQKIRLIGDRLLEKGKTRQMACRSSKREFLTWMNKDIKSQTFPRGELVHLHDHIEIKSNEIRLKKNL